MGIVVLGAPATTGAWVQGSSYLGYDNAYLRAGAVVSADAEDTGFPASNAASWLITGGGWRASSVTDAKLNLTLPASESINSFALYKHNLGTLGGITVKLQYSSDGVTWFDYPGSAQIPADDDCIYFIGDPQSARYWRIDFANIPVASTLIVGQAFIGLSLQMFNPPEPGFTPPQFALNNKYISSRADGGDFLGRSLVRKGAKMSFTNSIVHKDWMRANWADFMAAVEKTPFYYSWDSTNYPAEVAFCYVDKKIAIPKYVNSSYFSLNLQFIALQT